jgi:hypothetical protein
VAELLDEYKLPLLMNFDQNTAAILGENYPKKVSNVIWLLADASQSNTYEPAKKAVAEIAKSLRSGKNYLTVVVYQRGDIATMLKHFTMDTDKVSLPVVLVARFNPKKLKQQQFVLQSGKITTDGLKKGMADMAANKIDESIRTEKEVDDSDLDLKVVVGKNWQKKVIDPMQDVLVLFTHTSHCTSKSDGSCQNLQAVMGKLATALKGTESVAIAQINLQSNEIDHKAVSSLTNFPTIMLFCATDKNTPVSVEQKVVDEMNGLSDPLSSAGLLVRFLQDNAHIYFEPPDIIAQSDPEMAKYAEKMAASSEEREL